jgi:hypothetical protein
MTMAKKKQHRRPLIPLPPSMPLYVVRHQKDALPLVMRYSSARVDTDESPRLARVRFNGRFKTIRRRKTEAWFFDPRSMDRYVQRICAQVIASALLRASEATMYAHTYPTLTANV